MSVPFRRLLRDRVTATRWRGQVVQDRVCLASNQGRVAIDKALILSFEVLSVHGLFAEILNRLMVKGCLMVDGCLMIKESCFCEPKRNVQILNGCAGCAFT